jgi:hypothetical protein
MQAVIANQAYERYKHSLVESTTIDAGNDFLPACNAMEITNYAHGLGIYSLAMIVGTGGSSPALLYPGELIASTGTCVNVRMPLQKPMVVGVATTIRDKVAHIKVVFGLSIQQLADALGVKRPTIYSWLDPDEVVMAMREKNKKRIDELYGLAKAWKSISPHPPGGLLINEVFNGKSLFDLLCDADLAPAVIKEIIEQAARKVHAAYRKPLAQQLRDKGFAEIPPRFKGRGLPRVL